MGEWILPAAAGACTAGLLAWPHLARWGPPWAFLVVGAAAMIGAVLASQRPAPRPGVLHAWGLVDEAEPAALGSVAAERLEQGAAPPVVTFALSLTGVALIAAGVGGMHASQLDSSLMAAIVPNHIVAEGSIREDSGVGPYGWSVTLDLDVVAWDGHRVAVTEPVLVEGSGPQPRVARGDRVRVEGLAELPEPGEFATSLLRRGIVALVRATDVRRLGPPGNPLERAAATFRSALARSMRRVFPAREAGLLAGLALGDDAHLDPGLERDFRAVGLSHLLVASGQNVAMVLAPVLALTMLLRLPASARLVAGIGTVAFFVVLTGSEPSVLRAGLMAGLGLVGIFSGRPRSTVSLLGGSVLILLLLDPSLVWSIGFRLSVAATAGMVALAVPISRRLHLLPPPVALALSTTLAAQLGATPVLLWHFEEVPGITGLANVLAFPAVEPALVLGLMAAGLGAIWLPLGRVVAAAASIPMRWLEGVADHLARAPVPWITSGALGAVVVCAVAIAVGWRLRTGRRFPRSAVAAAALALSVLVWIAALSAGPPSGLRVTFFDVGQGDAALVRSPAGASVLVDGGPDEEQVAGKLAALGVRRLDLLIASHPHTDHVIGLPEVLARYSVGVALEPGCPDGSPIRAELMRAFRDEGTVVEHPRAGEAFAVGDLRIDVLSPNACYHGTESDANNDAIVVMLSWREDTVLFATEPEEPAQQTMLDSGARLQADVLKVPHHGAATSLPEFFDAVDPELAIVSVGPNSYGHPVPETLSELRSTGAEVIRTDRAGDVTVEFGTGGPRVDSAA